MPTRAEQKSRWAGVAPEDRRAERRALLVDAAYELLRTEGWAGTTVRGVCARAKLNARYFYESFDDIDALVVAVYDRLVAQLSAALQAAIEAAGADPRDQIRAAVETTVRFVDEDRGRARVLYVEALGSEALNRRRIETAFAGATFIARGSPLKDPVGQIAATVLVGGFSELLLAWIDGEIKVTRSQLIDDATALFIALGEATAAIASTRS